MIMRTLIEANIELARQRRRAAIPANNTRENRGRNAYDYWYKPGEDKVFVGCDDSLNSSAFHHTNDVK